MKFVIASLFVLFIISIANSQHHIITPLQTQTIPPPDSLFPHPQINTFIIPPYPNADSGVMFIAPGQREYTTIINNNSSTSTPLYPYLNQPGMEQIAWGDSFLLSYLLSQVNGIMDTDSIRLKLIQIMATKIEKTQLFYNELNFYYASDSNLYAKQNSLTGSVFGVYQKQCGDYIENTITTLIATGYFNYNNIQIVNLIGHVTGEFLYRGRFAFFDMDPGEPFFMITDSNNANGFASPLDIQNDTNLITESQRYYYVNSSGDSIIICPVSAYSTIQAYRGRFDSMSINPVPFTVPSDKVSGVITLPPHASIIANYKNTDYILDSSVLSNLYSLDNDYGIDTVYDALSRLLGISVDSATEILNQNQLDLNYTIQTWQPDYTTMVPAVKIALPATKDTVKIQDAGTAASINFAGYILGSTVEIYFPDTIFQAGESPGIWDTVAGTITSPNVSNGVVNYLAGNGGFILPHALSDTITVSYNPIIINFSNGFRLGYLTGDSIITDVFLNDSLTSSDSTYKTMPAVIHLNQNDLFIAHYDTLYDTNVLGLREDRYTADSIADFALLQNNPEVKIYPNPTVNVLHVSVSNTTSKLTLSLFDMIGKLVKELPITEGDNTVDIDEVESSTYICIINSSEEQIARKKIIIMPR